MWDVPFLYRVLFPQIFLLLYPDLLQSSTFGAKEHKLIFSPNKLEMGGVQPTSKKPEVISCYGRHCNEGRLPITPKITDYKTVPFQHLFKILQRRDFMKNVTKYDSLKHFDKTAGTKTRPQIEMLFELKKKHFKSEIYANLSRVETNSTLRPSPISASHISTDLAEQLVTVLEEKRPVNWPYSYDENDNDFEKKRSYFKKRKGEIGEEIAIDNDNKMTQSFDSHRFRRSSKSPEISPQKLHTHHHKKEPPEYMVHLFFLLSETRYDFLTDTVVTAFVNINDGETEVKRDEASTTTIDTLAFRVHLSEGKEIVQHAEIRVFISSKFPSSQRAVRVNVHELLEGDSQKLVFSDNVQVSPGEWESFNVTSDVVRWHVSSVRLFELTLSYDDEDRRQPLYDAVDGDHRKTDKPSISRDTGKEPILVVYSKKIVGSPVRTKRIKRDVRFDKLSPGIVLTSDDFKSKPNNNNIPVQQNSHKIRNEQSLMYRTPDEVKQDIVLQNSSHGDLDIRANTVQNAISKEILHLGSIFGEELSESLLKTVNFNKIKYSTFHLTEPSERRILHKTRNLREKILRKRLKSHGRRRESVIRKVAESRGYKPDGRFNYRNKKKGHDDVLLRRRRRSTKMRYKRHINSLQSSEFQTSLKRIKRSKRKRNSCRRTELWVEFEKINWGKVIIFPRGYQAFECRGKCYSPISKYLTPTKHAIIKTLLHTSQPKQVSRACCVPTKLDPISILYWDKNKDIKYDYSYDGMAVQECGCR